MSRSSTTFHKGYTHSQETRDKIRATLLGRKLSEEHKEKIRQANKCKRLSVMTDEIRVKISKSLTGRNTRGRWKITDEIRQRMSLAQKERYKTQKHPNYIEDRSLLKKDNRRNDSAYADWRMNVWRRDNFKCRIDDINCIGRIEAHHILSWRDYPELRYKINNGITLCHFHHPRARKEEKRLSPYFMELVSVSKLKN